MDISVIDIITSAWPARQEDPPLSCRSNLHSCNPNHLVCLMTFNQLSTICARSTTFLRLIYATSSPIPKRSTSCSCRVLFSQQGRPSMNVLSSLVPPFSPPTISHLFPSTLC